VNTKPQNRVTISRYVATAVIGTLALVVGGVGVATAANGGSLVLGHNNKATRTTTLTDKHGTPLALVGKASKPPLAVNSSKQVAHLNASLLGGRPASQLGPHAYVGHFNAPSSDGVAVSLDFDHPTQLAATSVLPAGTYLVSATENILGHSNAVYCAINSHQGLTDGIANGASPANLYGTPTESTVVTLSGPATLGAYCATDGGAVAAASYGASIWALRLLTITHGTAASP